MWILSNLWHRHILSQWVVDLTICRGTWSSSSVRSCSHFVFFLSCFVFREFDTLVQGNVPWFPSLNQILPVVHPVGAMLHAMIQSVFVSLLLSTCGEYTSVKRRVPYLHGEAVIRHALTTEVPPYWWLVVLACWNMQLVVSWSCHLTPNIRLTLRSWNFSSTFTWWLSHWHASELYKSVGVLIAVKTFNFVCQ